MGWRVRVSHNPPRTEDAREALAFNSSRLLRVSGATVRELLRLEEFTFPVDLSQHDADELIQVLAAQGISAQAVEVQARPTYCRVHPRLITDGACLKCGKEVCALCRVQFGSGTCSECEQRQVRRGRWRIARVALLLAILIGIVGWGWGQQRRREARRTWHRTLNVAAILLEHGDVDDANLRELGASVPRLEELLSREFARYARSTMHPFAFSAVGPFKVDRLPPSYSPDAGLVDRARYAYDLWRYFAPIRSRAGADLTSADIQIFVLTESPTRSESPRFVEGLAAQGGDVGIVHVLLDAAMLDHALLAIGHETLHCVGATDKYDELGHAVIPTGLVEPDLVPTYPQRFAEIMVGELPLGEARGRLPRMLDEVRVGMQTALEIGWTALAPAEPPPDTTAP